MADEFGTDGFVGAIGAILFTNADQASRDPTVLGACDPLVANGAPAPAREERRQVPGGRRRRP